MHSLLYLESGHSKTAIDGYFRPGLPAHSRGELRAAEALFVCPFCNIMWTGGILAPRDFVVATPALYRRHKLIDQYYAEHGKFSK